MYGKFLSLENNAMSEFRNVEHKVIFEKLADAPLYNRINGAGYEQRDDDPVGRYLREVAERVQTLVAQQHNPYYRVIVSHRKGIGKLIVFVKRVIRRLLKWLIEPICAQQTAFNSEVTPSIGRLVEVQVDTRVHIGKLHDRIGVLEAQQSARLAELEQQVAKAAELEQQVAKVAELEQQVAKVAELEQQMAKLADIERNYSILQDKLSAYETASDMGFWNKRSMAQSGEDMIAAYITYVLGIPPQDCTYLDLGANRAKELSNTFYFYCKGASGVLVEANPLLINELKFYRSRDVILNKCVAPVSGQKVEFYVLSGDGLSTPDYAGAMEAIERNPSLSIVDTVIVETISVNDIFTQYFSKTPVILNIDIEGKELEILESIDFEKYRPLIIILETIPYRPRLVYDEKKEDIVAFLKGKNYTEYAFTGINSIFVDREKLSDK